MTDSKPGAPSGMGDEWKQFDAHEYLFAEGGTFSVEFDGSSARLRLLTATGWLPVQEKYVGTREYASKKDDAIAKMKAFARFLVDNQFVVC